MKSKATFSFFIILLFFFFINFYFHNNNSFTINEPITIDTDNTQSTNITPVLDAKIEPETNLIYCSTMQMAWKILCNDIIKGKIEFDKKPWYVDNLNNLINEPTQISEDSYIAMAGFGKDNIVNKIKNELIKKFNIHNLKILEIAPDDILAFSCLNKSLDFKEKFRSFESKMFFRKKLVNIKTFGLCLGPDRKKLKEQVKILYIDKFDHHYGNFVIELKSQSLTDEIVISNITCETTLLSTFNKIQEKIKLFEIENKQIKDGNMYNKNEFDNLTIPKINFVITHQFNEIINKKVNNDTLKGYFIKNVIQMIKFSLNEKGASILSSAQFSAERGYPPPDLEIKGPFIIYLKNKNSSFPYFMAYIGNEEILEKN